MALQCCWQVLPWSCTLGADPAWCWCCPILWHCWRILHGHVLGLGVLADPRGHTGSAQPCSTSWDPVGPAAPLGGQVPAGAVAQGNGPARCWHSPGRATACARGKQVPAGNRCRRWGGNVGTPGARVPFLTYPTHVFYSKQPDKFCCTALDENSTQKGLNSLRSAEGVGTNTVLKHFIKNIYC